MTCPGVLLNDNIFAGVHFEQCTPAFLLDPHHDSSVALHAVEPEIAAFFMNAIDFFRKAIIL